MEKICVSCNKSLKKLARKNYYWSDEQWYCKACYQIKVKHPSSSTQSVSEDVVVEENIGRSAIENSSVTLNINRNVISSKCIFGCQSDRVLRRLSREECLNIHTRCQKWAFFNTLLYCCTSAMCAILIRKYYIADSPRRVQWCTSYYSQWISEFIL